MKTKAIIGASVAVILIAVWGIIRIKNNNIESAPALESVPMDAFMIVRSDNLLSVVDNLLNDNMIWENLSTVPQIEELSQELVLFDSLANEYSDFSSVLETRQVVVSAHMLTKAKIGMLLSTSLKNSGERRSLDEQIRELLGKNYKIQERNYDGAEIHDIRKGNDARFNLSYTVHKGIFLIAKSAILVEKAIRQLNLHTSLMNNSDFVHSVSIAGQNVKGNLFLNLSEVSQFLSFLAPYGEIKLEGVKNMGGWMVLDLSTMHSKDWLLTGFTQASDTMSHVLGLFKNQEPIKPSAVKYLPKQTAFFQYLGISDIYQFRRDYNRVLRKFDEFDLYKHYINTVKEKYNFNPELDFEVNLEEEVMVSYSSVNYKIESENQYFIAKIRNRGSMIDFLNSLAKRTESIDSSSNKKHSSEYSLNEVNKITIWKFPLTDYTYKMYRYILPDINTGYATVIENYLIMGKSPEALKAFANAYFSNMTFETNPEFKNFIETLSSRSNLLIYNDVENSADYWKKYFSNDLTRVLNQNRNMFNKFQAIALQISKTNDLLFTNIFLKLNPKGSLKPNVVWAAASESEILLKPAIVINHQNKEREVFVQDKANKVYLIDKNGRTLWSKKLSEPIKSEIYQVDVFKNGKFQLAFSTENYLHIIDRLGNYVENFPVKFQAPATNGMAIFDYDKKRDYRILVAAKNKQVYAYDIKGSIIKGWEFNLTQNLVYGKIQHFVDAGKDYIVFSDELKTYILDRRGKIRLNPKSDFPRSANNIFYLDKATKSHPSRLLSTSISGTVMFLYLNDGKVTKLETQRFSPKHHFIFTDVNGDGIEEFVYADENRLKVIQQNLEQLYEVKLKAPLATAPNLYNFGNGNLQLGITDNENSEIFLLNGKDGSVVNGFPQEGSTEFSITKFTTNQSKFSLIVGNKNNFLYNYLLK